MRLVLASIAAVALVSCGQPADDVAAETADVPAVNEVVPANDAAADANEDVPATPPFAETPEAHPTAPEPAPIPAKFRGTWAESKAACADEKHHSRLGISGRTVRYPKFVVFGESMTATAEQFSLKGKIEGTETPAEEQFFINEAGDELTDGGGGGAVWVRCG